MEGRSRILLVVAVVFASFLLNSSPEAVIPKYVEDFSGLKFCDTSVTTAWWVVDGAELKLYHYQPTMVDSIDTPGYAEDIVVAGDYAYAACGGSGGIQVIDISDPESMVIAGSFDTPGAANGIAVAGNYAFIADGSAGLTVIDITVQEIPVFVANLDTPDYARGIEIDGNYAYVADEDDGLRIIDISDPALPVAVDFCDTPGEVHDVAVSGNYAYVPDFALGGLQVVDISDPTSTFIVDNYNTPGTAYSVTVSGDYAYVADWQAGLVILDISDPTDIVLAGSVDPGYVLHVVIVGDYAYAAGFYDGLHVIDVNDPGNPSLIASCDTENAHAVAVDGEYAFVADFGGDIKSIKVCELSGIMKAGEIEVTGGYQMTTAGNIAYVVNDDLYVIDISDPDDPVLVTQHDVPGFACAVDISGDHAYVGTIDFGMNVLDISDIASPSAAGYYYYNQPIWDIKVSGNHAYLAVGGSNGLLVLDVSDPENPAYAGTVLTSGSAIELEIDGDFMFLATQSGGVNTIDISDPTTPDIIGFYSAHSSISEISLAGDCLFACDQLFAMLALDASDPNDFGSVLGYSWNLIEHYHGDMEVSGNELFIQHQNYGLIVYNNEAPDYFLPLAMNCIHANPDLSCPIGELAVYGDYVIQSGGDYFILAKVYNRIFEPAIAQSKRIAYITDPVASVRVTTSQADSIMWEVSADSGSHWTEVRADGLWKQMEYPGEDLFWRASLVPALRRRGPSCRTLEIEWAFDMADISSVVDVPADQGGWVRVHFTRSGRDIPGLQGDPVTAYYLYRRIDDPLLRARVLNEGKQSAPNSLCLDGRTFRLPSAATGSFPPGMWEVVGESPALNIDQYIILAPTLADSSITLKETVFCILASVSPSEWYVSHPDSGWSVDNIAPGVPLGLAVAYNTGGGNDLSWDPSTEPDFQYYRIYRGDDEDFIPDPANLVHETSTPQWTDPEYDGWDVHYKVTALDYVGNESDAASAATSTGDDTPQVPESFALYQNVPNPFNPSTTISFDLPKATHVDLKVYNIRGELIATLAGGNIAAGRREISWDGLSDGGSKVASGVYFYRLVTKEFEETKKMILLR